MMNTMFFKILVIVLVILASYIFFLIKRTPKIYLSSQKVLVDEQVEISISNLFPQEQIAVEVSCKDKDKNIWRSSALFKANGKGIVDVATQSPVSGFYAGVDPMGLFWSMTSMNKENPIFDVDDNKDVLEVLLSVFSQNKLRAQKTIYRLLILPDIEKRQIREQGIVGTIFYPKNMQQGPGVIVIPGSNGGIPEKKAKILASHGYAVLALGYFGLEGLPETLENIHLEYFQNAMQWFKRQPQVDADRIALLGSSIGGELVLILATIFPKEINAVIANVPSGIVYGGFPRLKKPCWFYKNSPLSFIPLYPTNDLPSPSNEEILRAIKEGEIPFHKGTFEDPFDYSAVFLYGMKKFHQTIEAATIPVENINCSILLLSGEDDKVWPSALYGKLIMERLDKKKSIIKRKHMHFVDAGHAILFPYPRYMPTISQPVWYPEGKHWSTFGGTVEGNARANNKSWQEVLDFLKKSLQNK